MSNEDREQGGAIAWMARNGVASNLLMLLLLVGGALALMRIKQEVFPEFTLDVVTVALLEHSPGNLALAETVDPDLGAEKSVGGVEGFVDLVGGDDEGQLLLHCGDVFDLDGHD